MTPPLESSKPYLSNGARNSNSRYPTCSHVWKHNLSSIPQALTHGEIEAKSNHWTSPIGSSDADTKLYTPIFLIWAPQPPLFMSCLSGSNVFLVSCYLLILFSIPTTPEPYTLGFLGNPPFFIQSTIFLLLCVWLQPSSDFSIYSSNPSDDRAS